MHINLINMVINWVGAQIERWEKASLAIISTWNAKNGQQKENGFVGFPNIDKYIFLYLFYINVYMIYKYMFDIQVQAYRPLPAITRYRHAFSKKTRSRLLSKKKKRSGLGIQASITPNCQRYAYILMLYGLTYWPCIHIHAQYIKAPQYNMNIKYSNNVYPKKKWKRFKQHTMESSDGWCLFFWWMRWLMSLALNDVPSTL